MNDPEPGNDEKFGEVVLPFLGSLLLVLVVLLIGQIGRAESTVLITQAHAHNDYMHTRPLRDALDNGFCSVEADIFLTNGELLVAHDLRHVRPGLTLQALYLDPLRERVRQNGGRVFTNGPEFTLLIELKQDWRVSWPALRDVLTNYADVLVAYTHGVKRPNAITAIITGHRDPAMFAGDTMRYAALDGAVSDLAVNPPASLVPWISGNWKADFQWDGVGAMPDDQLQKLRGIVSQAHEQGRRVRYWNAPDKENFWQAMHVAGVDLINTDDLPGVAKFFGRSDVKDKSATPGQD